MKKEKVKMVGYSNRENHVIICLSKDEKRMLKLYFKPGTGRDLGDYGRFEVTDFVDFYPSQNFSFDGSWS